MSKDSDQSRKYPDTTVVTTPIAIIGMASLFPGAKNLQEYWNNILQNVNCISEIPPSRWSIEDYYHPDPHHPDSTYCKAGGFIPDIDFDPSEFGLPPNILQATDVSQLLALSIARDALEDAGYDEEREFDRQRAGVILGVVGISMKLFSPMMARLQYPIWQKVLKSQGMTDEEIHHIIEKIKLAYPAWEENTFPGMIGNVIAGRIANRFNLGGTNCTVDAACGSSLAAVKSAVGELIENRADIMLTGGVDLDNSIGTFLCFSKTPAFSKKGQIRPFDEDADGMLAGEGIGMLVLKRLEDAERDEDRIYAVIQGIGSSSDGRYKSIYAPRAEGQAVAIQRAYHEAGFDIHSIGLLEAHGTGTLAGDPEEVRGILMALQNAPTDTASIALGSVKSQIGHTKAAAGSASLIKTALALYHKVLPATLHVEHPNPKLNIENSALYLNTETRPWISQENHPRRAGVSAFGFGGTNFHIALQEYSSEHKHVYRWNCVANALFLSAADPTALLQHCRDTLTRLSAPDGPAFLNELILQSSQMVIEQHTPRVGFAARNVTDAQQVLSIAIQTLQDNLTAEQWEHPAGIYYRNEGINTTGRVVALFSGQGSQYINMGRELAMNYPEVRQVYQEIDGMMQAGGADAISERVFPTPVFDEESRERQKSRLQSTENAQPAIGAFSASLYKIFEQAGFTADFSAGHSFGELGALWAAGVLNDEEYYRLIIARGKAMSTSPEAGKDCGAMIAVKGNAAAVCELLKEYPEIILANWNSNRQVVLAGKTKDIEAIQPVLQAANFSVIPLPVSAAFHTNLVSYAQKPFAEALKTIHFKTPRIPVYANNSGKAHARQASTIRKKMVDHILLPVLFKEEIEQIYRDGGRIFIEFGPRNVVTHLVKEILEDKEHIAVALNASARKDSDLQLKQAYAFLKVTGLPLGNIDPYRQAIQPPHRVQKMSVTLNGGAYLSEKTRNAFLQALESGPRRKTDSPAMQIPEDKEYAAVSSPMASQGEVQQNIPSTTDIRGKSRMNSISTHYSPLQENRKELVYLQEEFNKQQAEYTHTYSRLILSQMDLLQELSSQPEKFEKMLPYLQRLEDNLEQFQQIQKNCVDAHQQFCQSLSSTSPGTVAQPAQPLSTGPRQNRSEKQSLPENDKASLAKALPEAPIQPANENAQIEVKDSTSSGRENNLEKFSSPEMILKIISEKTGYPAEMLEPGMDMEADLGIDSIKRVEIISALREAFPQLPTLEAEQFTDIRTPEDILTLLKSQEDNTPTTAPEPLPVTRSEQKNPSHPENTQESPPDVNTQVLRIVSEKTGYPGDMLEAGMDMEADLGIDSIKRVEIISALRESFPQMPHIETQQFSEIKTLKDIGDFIHQAFDVPPVQNIGVKPESATENAFPVMADFFPREVSVKNLPEPDYQDLPFSSEHSCLITDDGTELTVKLAQKLQDSFHEVIVLSFPEDVVPSREGMPQGIRRVRLASIEEDHLRQQLESICTQEGNIAAFIHLNARYQSSPEAGILYSDTQKRIIKAVFLIASHLKTPLTRAGQNARAFFLTVTHLDGELGLANGPEFEPVEGGLSGLVKTLALEWESVFCRSIDFAPQIDSDETVEKLLAELHDPNLTLTEVGYSPAGRVTLQIAAPEVMETN